LINRFNITIDHSTSVHGSAQSSLSDEEDSSGTGVQVSPPSATGSQDYPENYEDSGEWDHVIYPDELNPSDSASRPRTSNQHRPTDPPRGGATRQGSRRHTSREHERRRPPPSPGSVASSDDYEAYVRGGPDRRYYPPVPAGPPITYAPSSSSGHSYNPYLPPGIPSNQLVPIGGAPQFPYPHQYPPPNHHPGAGFIGSGHPVAAPIAHHMPSHGGTPYAGPPYGGHEMYQAPAPGAGYFPYPQPYAMPQGMIPSPFYHPYQRIHSPPILVRTPPPQPAAASPPPPPPAPAPAPEPPKNDEGIARLEQLLLYQKEQQEKREAALEQAAKDKADLEAKMAREKEIASEAAKAAAADAKATAEAKAAEDVAKAREEAATKAAADARAEAEAKATVDLAKAKEEAEKHAKEASEAADAAMKKAVAEAAEAASKPPAEKKKPIKFKDAVGRKFSFPFHLCCTWAVSSFLDVIPQNTDLLS
jgi:hypothetical protein